MCQTEHFLHSPMYGMSQHLTATFCTRETVAIFSVFIRVAYEHQALVSKASLECDEETFMKC